MQKQISSSCEFLARTCIDKQLACKLFLFTTTGSNSTVGTYKLALFTSACGETKTSRLVVVF